MAVLTTVTAALSQHDQLSALCYGILAHNLVFVHGEWHLKGPHVAVAHLVAITVSMSVQMVANGKSVTSALLSVLQQFTCYSMGLFLSMFVYRAAFHRLRHFRGPWLAKYTKLWHAYHCIPSQNHLFLHGLYKQYGEFVRTGPSELTVFHPDVCKVTDGYGNTCTKSVWYDMMNPEQSLVAARDKKVHDTRRRVWERGFDTTSLKYYDSRVIEYAEQLRTHAQEAASSGCTIDLNDLFYWFGWDVMGDVVFGKPFKMLENEHWRSSVMQLKRAMGLLGPVTPVPWLAHLGFAFLPGIWLVKDWFTTIEFCRQQMQDRIHGENRNPDIAYHLIEDARRNGFREADQHWLTGDSVLAIVAGSDTVTGTLIALFYHLAQEPCRMENLYREVKDIDAKDLDALAQAEYLNALINETLRMHPALPSGGVRETGPEGVMIGGTFIPGHTTIVAPRYSLGRMESCFERAEEFVPERWTSRADMIKNRKPFAPFGTGRYACIGKNLALTELRIVTATLAKSYKLRFAPGEDGRRFERDFKDCFTPAPGQVEVMFEER